MGGNPLSVPAIYAMIHFVEKTWGIHYAMGGTGALVRAFVRKFEELGGDASPTTRRGRDSGHGWTRPAGQATHRQADGAGCATGGRRGTARRHRGQQRRLGQHHTSSWIPAAARLVNSDVRVKAARQSMSLLVIYFGFRRRSRPPAGSAPPQHHSGAALRGTADRDLWRKRC